MSTSTDTLPAVYALRYGTLEPLPEPLILRAGPLSCQFENGDLRNIYLGTDLILMRLYAAVRDRNWGTVPAAISVTEHKTGEDWFRLAFTAGHRQTTDFDDIHFVWTGTIEGTADGTLTFEFAGEAKTTFHRNRIGFCLLHPADSAGHPVTIIHTDGKSEESEFPGLVDPRQPVFPFADMCALVLTTRDGKQVEIAMDGDVFEMEDQRNWTDASYKTFCTPLALPYPVEIKAGQHVQQWIRILLHSKSTGTLQQEQRPSRKSANITLTNGDASKLPQIGSGHVRPNPRRSLGSKEEAHLRLLSLSHLRVDVRFDTDWRKNFAYVADSANRLGVPLAVALYLPENDEARQQGLKTLAWEIRQTAAHVGQWLVYPEREVYAGQGWPDIPRDALKTIAPDAAIITGSDSDFIFFSRLQGVTPAVNGVTFQINPQVHAFDNASLMETPSVYEAVVETARLKAGNLPVHISPLTLKPRYNAYARVENPPPIPPDPRQKSLFAAAWVVNALAALTVAGVSSVTLFDAVGDRGIVQGNHVYPAWFPLAWLAPHRDKPAVPLVGSVPFRVAGITVGPVTLAANLTNDTLTASIPVSPAIAHVRMLDERSAVAACADPDWFRMKQGEYRASHNGTITVELSPYAVVCLSEL